jgi:hypothetical protein
MTVLKGLVEALLLFVIGLVVAAVVAAIWVSAGGGGYLNRLGITLLIIGALLAISGDLTLTKLSTHDTFAWFGAGPEREGAGGGRILTGVGIFLFVAVPLIFVGGVLLT